MACHNLIGWRALEKDTSFRGDVMVFGGRQRMGRVGPTGFWQNGGFWWVMTRSRFGLGVIKTMGHGQVGASWALPALETGPGLGLSFFFF